MFANPEPSGKITEILKEGAALYRRIWTERFDLGPGSRDGGGGLTIICDSLVGPLGDFHGPARHGYCTVLAADVSAVVAEVLIRLGVPVEAPSIDGIEF